MKQMAIDAADRQTLPLDIISDILKRLPVKTLIRFQCVCKPWKYLIKSSSFIAEQIHYATQQCPALIFCRIREFSAGNRDCSLGLRLLDCNMGVRELPEPPLVIDPSNHASIVCSSNGLLCLRISKSRLCSHQYPPSLLVWNPAIWEARLLPQTSVLVDYTGNFSVGFGFSPITNDHKILLIRFSPDSFDVASLAEVYSLSSCSWKVVDCGLLDGTRLKFQTVTSNGYMFWVGFKRCVHGDGVTRIDRKIVSFNIATEVFTLIPMPSPSFLFDRLAVCEKKLCIIAAPSYSPVSGSKIHWWVMEDEGCDWIEKCISCPLSCALYPATVWKNEIVCHVGRSPSATECAGVNDEPNFALLNLTTGGYKLFAFPKCYHVIDHLESLVPVRGKKYLCTCTF